MSDTTEVKSVSVSVPARLADFVGSAWAKVLTILAAISIVMGILLEAEGLISGYYEMKRNAAEAEMSRAKANGGDHSMPRLPRDNSF
jgi:hypothetical protein